MNKQLILELQNHNVYYIRTEIVNYYITVPKKFQNTNISVEIKNRMGNYDMDLNDEVWVMENVKNTFTHIDDYNITLILPVLSETHISILEKIDNTKYEEIDKLIGYVINSSYTVLKENDIKVSNQIILVNNDRYSTFITWFTTKYKNRVTCQTLLELIQLFNVNATAYKKLETPVMNFVVGSYNTEVTAPKSEQKEIKIENPQIKTQVSYGYATYWILAAVTLVISCVVAVIAFTVK